MLLDDKDLRARQAQELLQHPLVQEALAALAKEAVTRWSNAKTPEAREDAWHDQQAARRLAGWFANVVQTGQFEKEKDERSRKTRAL